MSRIHISQGLTCGPGSRGIEATGTALCVGTCSDSPHSASRFGSLKGVLVAAWLSPKFQKYMSSGSQKLATMPPLPAPALLLPLHFLKHKQVGGRHCSLTFPAGAASRTHGSREPVFLSELPFCGNGQVGLRRQDHVP